MQDSLERYPHTTVELTGSNVTAAALDWAEGEGVDILVMGAHARWCNCHFTEACACS